MRRPQELEFESGQIVVDKARCWRALRLSLWFNENSDFYYRYLHGDKETFHLAFRKLRKSYALVDKSILSLAGTMCQHDFEGNRIFQHRNTDKWNLLPVNRRVPGFRHEDQCRKYLRQLRRLWDGKIRTRSTPIRSITATLRRSPIVRAVMISCPERTDLRHETLKKLSQTDWGAEPVHVQMDHGRGEDFRCRQTATALEALRWGVSSGADYTLFLEDDLAFNRHLRHNLEAWEPVRTWEITLAGLYNPGLRETAYDLPNRAVIVAPGSIFGSQAFLIARATAAYILRHWNQVDGMQDIKFSRLAGRQRNPILYHCPSLVQHVGRKSLWGGQFHQAADFDADWRA